MTINEYMILSISIFTFGVVLLILIYFHRKVVKNLYSKLLDNLNISIQQEKNIKDHLNTIDEQRLKIAEMGEKIRNKDLDIKDLKTELGRKKNDSFVSVMPEIKYVK